MCSCLRGSVSGVQSCYFWLLLLFVGGIRELIIWTQTWVQGSVIEKLHEILSRQAAVVQVLKGL